jgi:hypothetical protein
LSTINPKGITYFGRPLEELSQAELITCIEMMMEGKTQWDQELRGVQQDHSLIKAVARRGLRS